VDLEVNPQLATPRRQQEAIGNDDVAQPANGPAGNGD